MRNVHPFLACFFVAAAAAFFTGFTGICGIGTVTAWGAAREEAAGAGGFTLEDFQTEEIDEFLSGLSGTYGETISFRGIMEELLAGNLDQAAEDGAKAVGEALFSEVRTNAALMGQIVALALVGAVFSSFSEIFGAGHLSESGFYVIYLCIMAFLAASFYASIQVAEEVAGDILEFMRLMLPAYFWP